MTLHNRIVGLSALVTLVGFAAQPHIETEAGPGCTGVLHIPVNECTGEEDNWKQACKDYFGPILGCGKPGYAACGSNGGEELYIACNYNA